MWGVGDVGENDRKYLFSQMIFLKLQKSANAGGDPLHL